MGQLMDNRLQVACLYYTMRDLQVHSYVSAAH